MMIPKPSQLEADIGEYLMFSINRGRDAARSVYPAENHGREIFFLFAGVYENPGYLSGCTDPADS
jgi:hypothetical protein